MEATREFAVKPEGDSRVVGYAIVYGMRSKLISDNQHPTPYFEEVEKGAFDGTLKTKHNVRLLYEHDPKEHLAQTDAGSLEIKGDDTGILFGATLPKTARAEDIKALKAEMGASWFATILDAKWTKTEDGKPLRKIRKAVLHEVSLTPHASYKAPIAFRQDASKTPTRTLQDYKTILETIATDI